ncbi:MAG: class I SAM-dependent methyltransferase [Clostridia bacterium]|nr:class I SAM-dependent methyltransferase [Clostridia bacterium]
MINEIIRLREKAKQAGEPVLRDKSFELLLDTVKKEKPKKILEIGVNLGLSGIAMLISEPNASLSGIEIDEEKIKLAKNNYKKFGVFDRAKIFQGDASEIIPVLTGEYDFIFLDGPKGHYYEYLPNLLSVLSVGGTLFADNVLFRGYVLGSVKTPHRFNTTKHSMENFLNAISTDSNLSTKLYEMEDGVSITKKIK